MPKLDAPESMATKAITEAAATGVRPRSIRCGALCRLTPACTGKMKTV